MSEYFEHGAGLRDIIFQRQHQIELGYTVEYDNREHTPEELFRVGYCYAEYGTNEMEGIDQDRPHPFWPEDTSIEWRDEGSPMEYLIKGAAFIAAGLDLLNAQLMGEVKKDE